MKTMTGLILFPQIAPLVVLSAVMLPWTVTLSPRTKAEKPSG